MTTKSNYWTGKTTDGKWSVKKEGANGFFSVHDNQDIAWKETRRLAKGEGSEALLKSVDGKIVTRSSYGSAQ